MGYEEHMGDVHDDKIGYAYVVRQGLLLSYRILPYQPAGHSLLLKYVITMQKVASFLGNQALILQI